MNTNNIGTLYIVATPIGNLEDITLRALEVLKKVDSIVAEDTRHSQALLQQYSINTPIFALHEHNERERTAAIVKRLQAGESLALISDAGTPLISDPGYFLVKEARLAGIKVVPVPGACAAIAALSVAGVATDRFVFEGFLAAKAGARLQQLEKLKNETRTLVFYEAPHRILETLAAMQEVFGADRPVVIARELTKMFETIASGSVGELIAFVQGDSNQRRGEFVVVVEGLREVSQEVLGEAHRMLGILLESLPLKQAVELTTKITGQKKNDIYEVALQLKNQSKE